MPTEALRILLVEDDVDDAQLVTALLQEAAAFQASVAIASDLTQASSDLASGDWDAVLMDLGFADRWGIEALHKICAGIPVVILAGAEDIESARAATREGAQDYLPKADLSAELLVRTIRYAIERSQMRKELGEERERLFAVLDALPMFVYLQAPDHTIPFANRTFRDLFGEVEGRLCYELFHGCRRPCDECPPMRVQETGEPEISEWTSVEGRTYAIYDQVFPGPGDAPLTLEVGLDITEQKQAQERLARSESRFRRLAENAPDIIYRYRIAPNPGFDYISPAVTQVSGYTPEEYYADPLLGLKVVHPEDRHFLEGLVHGRLPARRTHDIRWIHRDGDVRWTEDHHTPVYDESGLLIAIEGVTRDITEWKRSQEALAESEERYRSLFEHAGIGIGYYTPDGVVIGYNRVAAAQLAGEPEDFPGKTIVQIFGEENGSEYLRRVVDAAGNPEAVTYEDFAELPTGSKWFLSTYSRVKDPNGEVVGVQVFSEEITDRKAAEAALYESERRFRELAELLPEVIYECDLAGRITFANRIAFERFGYTEEDLASGLNALEMLVPEDRDRAGENIRRILNGEHVGGTEYTALAGDGSTFPVIVHSSPASRGGEPVGLRGIVVDVTEQRKAREALRTADEIVSALPTGMLIYQHREADELILVSGNSAASPFVDLEKNIGTEMEAHWPLAMVECLREPLVSIARDGGIYDRETAIGPPVDRHVFHVRAFRIPGNRVVVAFEDITERRLAEASVVEWKNRYEGAVRASRHILYDWDSETDRVTYAGDFERILGYTEEEMSGGLAHWIDLIHPEDRGDFEDAIDRLRQTHAPAHLQYRVRRKDGEHIDIEDDGNFITDADGRVIRMLGFVKDVTERRHAEAALRDSETRYRSIFEDAILGIYRTTPDGKILAANPALVQMLGYDSFEELAERNLEKGGYEPETPRAEFKEWIEQAGHFAGRESAWKRRDGTTIYVRENARVVRDSDGEPLYYEGTIEDITDRKAAEREAEALRAQLELTQFSIDSIEAVILWVLPDGSIDYVNDAACRMLGYTRDELLGMSVWNIDPEYAKEHRPLKWDEIKHARRGVTERTFRKKDGELFPVEITAQYLEFRGRELEFAVAFDITEKKRLEARLRQSQRLESIGTLASGVAHEINNPLTGIINYAQLISDRIDDEKLKGFADGIREEGDRVAGIVRNLLSFSRQEKEHSSPARMIDIVNASLSLYLALLRRDRIELVVDVPEDLPVVECRSQEIQQVVINLITNARDSLNLRFPEAHEDKQIAIRARVLEEDDGAWIRLTVEDRGQGIPPETIGRVFDPFYTTKPRDQGTGLGLSISYGLVRDHGGRMAVESVPNEVTRFTVDLPVGAE